MIKINEQFFMSLFYEALLKEARVTQDFIQIIDSAADKSLKKNGKIIVDDIFKAIAQEANKFADLGETNTPEKRRRLDFEDDKRHVVIKDIDTAKQKEKINFEKEQNKKDFLDWFNQSEAKESFGKLISKYKDKPVFTTSKDETIQREFNAKFISDCITYYLQVLSENPHPRFRFIGKVSRNILR